MTERPSVVVEAASSGAVVGVGLAVVTVGIVFALLLAVGFAILVRRGRRSRRSRPLDDMAVRADIALVRLDDDVSASADELGYAVAQFGEQPSEPLRAALASARTSLAAAFTLKQQLDDAHPDTATQQREWNARILMLCETAAERLATERTVFDSMRGLERSAAADLASVRALIEVCRKRIPDAAASVQQLSIEYSAHAVAPIAEAPAEAARLLEAASAAAEDAAGRVDDSGVSSISSIVRSAERDALRATQLLDRVEAHGSALVAASARLASVIAEARAMVADAKPVRASPPDPQTGEAVGDAIAYVERTIAGVAQARPDPDAAIARVSASADALDTALAGARNQEQRLTHARDALAGALLTARSQVDTTRAYIAARRGGASAEARTRLAEAERLLELAAAEADPVIALDTARSSATYSRDADALARYDLLH